MTIVLVFLAIFVLGVMYNITLHPFKLIWKAFSFIVHAVAVYFFAIFIVVVVAISLERIIESIPPTITYYIILVLVNALIGFVIWMFIMAIKSMYDYGQGNWK